MTNRADIEKLIHDTWRARRADDYEGTLAGYHPDASFRFVACADFGPMAKRVSGAELAAQLRMLIDGWDLSGLEIESIGIDGETAYVRHRGKAVSKQTGKAMDADVLDVITVRDGKFIDYVQYTDTYLVAKTAGLI